jgi:calcineurin-like phosphoesterase family protein
MKGMNTMDKIDKQRNKEDIMNTFAKAATPIKDESLNAYINNFEKNGHDIWVMTDWHLYKRDKKGGLTCHKRSDYDRIKSAVEKIPEDDLLIFLGDIVDGECTNSNEVKKFFKDVKCNRIICLGNNDLYHYNTYREMGFRYVLHAFEYKRIVFSHYPIKNTGLYNIHGHLHSTEIRHPVYWIPFTNQIDIAYFGGRVKPLKLYDIANPKTFNKYKNIASEDSSHFNESYTIFEYRQLVDEYLNDDPYDD